MDVLSPTVSCARPPQSDGVGGGRHTPAPAVFACVLRLAIPPSPRTLRRRTLLRRRASRRTWRGCKTWTRDAACRWSVVASGKRAARSVSSSTSSDPRCSRWRKQIDVAADRRGFRRRPAACDPGARTRKTGAGPHDSQFGRPENPTRLCSGLGVTADQIRTADLLLLR